MHFFGDVGVTLPISLQGYTDRPVGWGRGGHIFYQFARFVMDGACHISSFNNCGSWAKKLSSLFCSGKFARIKKRGKNFRNSRACRPGSLLSRQTSRLPRSFVENGSLVEKVTDRLFGPLFAMFET